MRLTSDSLSVSRLYSDWSNLKTDLSNWIHEESYGKYFVSDKSDSSFQTYAAFIPEIVTAPGIYQNG